MSVTSPAAFAIPARISRANRWAIPREGVDSVVVNALTIDLIVILLIQKVAMPVGPTQLTCVVFPHFATLAFLAYTNRLTLSTTRLVMFVSAFVVMGAGQLIGSQASINWGSYVLGLISYSWWIFIIGASRESYYAFLKRFVMVGVGVAGLVFLDHVLQLAGPGMPNLNYVIPEAWNYHHYVYIQPLYWGSPWSKPNAIFFLEVSQTSQFIAMALVVELCLFRRLRYLLVLVPSLMATFAGTGLLLTLLCVPFLAAKLLKPKYIIMACVLIPLVGVGAVATGWTDVLDKRSGELDKSGSSANGRFVAPFEAIRDFATESTSEQVLYGEGAGALEYNTYVLHIALSKVLLEYGLLAAVLFMIYINYSTFFSGAPFVIAWAGALQYELLNGAFLVPLMIILMYLLSGGFKLEPERPRRLPRLTLNQSRLLGEQEPEALEGRGVFG